MAITIQSSDGLGAPANNTDIDASGNNFAYTASRLSFSGSYSTGGDTLDLTPLLGSLPSGALPISMFAEGNGPTASQQGGGGYYAVLAGTTLANNKLKIFSSGGSEIGAGAYPAAVTTDVVTLQILWRKLRNF
jgi:hypothetical protein